MIDLENNSGDIVITSETKREYKFYSILLCLHSGYFDRYFQANDTNKKRVETKLGDAILGNLLQYLWSYSKGVFQEAREFVRGGCQEINWLEWIDLAEYYDIPHLKTYCQQELVVDLKNFIEPVHLNVLFKYDLSFYKQSVVNWFSNNGFEGYKLGHLEPHVIGEFSRNKNYYRVLYMWAMLVSPEIAKANLDELIMKNFKKNKHVENDQYLYDLLPFLSLPTRVVILEALAENYISLIPRLTKSLPHSELFLDD